MPKSLVVAVDLDGIVANLHERWLELHNDDSGDRVTLRDLKHWDMRKNLKSLGDIYEYLAHPGLYLTLDPLPGALDALNYLRSVGHDVHILTAPAEAAQTAADKISWVRNQLPDWERQCITLSHQKHRFLCDVLIDDAPSHHRKIAKTQPNVLRMGVAWPYNEEAADVMFRAPSFEDPKRAWSLMVDRVDELSMR